MTNYCIRKCSLITESACPTISLFILPCPTFLCYPLLDPCIFFLPFLALNFLSTRHFYRHHLFTCFLTCYLLLFPSHFHHPHLFSFFLLLFPPRFHRPRLYSWFLLVFITPDSFTVSIFIAPDSFTVSFYSSPPLSPGSSSFSSRPSLFLAPPRFHRPCLYSWFLPLFIDPVSIPGSPPLFIDPVSLPGSSPFIAPVSIPGSSPFVVPVSIPGFSSFHHPVTIPDSSSFSSPPCLYS
ncbi:unnamed protein product [Acanthosepion pharaonis]|uniref:Uncharacterized protein n=1 Tax=Acanthosepion pharaonis TaxID=158019 RepID=A0A812ARV1_ACAPH|nr:unnamed protein product [Sepia pharaonis]